MLRPLFFRTCILFSICYSAQVFEDSTIDTTKISSVGRLTSRARIRRACDFLQQMRTLGVGSRLSRSATTGLDVESRRRSSRSWKERWSSSLPDSRRARVVFRRKHSPFLLAVVLVVAVFLLARVSVHSRSLFGFLARHRVSTRPRIKANPCNLNFPEAAAFEENEDSDVNTPSLLDAIAGLPPKPRIGLVNIAQSEALQWQKYAQGMSPVHFPFAKVNQSLKWANFFPEWIDEEEEYALQPECPPLPGPCVHNHNLDLVVARVPCRGDNERNVRRLQVLLAAGSVASRAGNDEEMHVLIRSECRPALNLFPCGELLKHEGQWWLYRVDVVKMRRRLDLPVGSCELSLSTHWKEQLAVKTGNERREAYVSMVHTDSSYVCGAIVLAHSIRLSGSTRDLVMLVDDSIPLEKRQGLEEAGWQVRVIERIRNPYAEKDRYNEWNYSKFRLWQLTEYDKIVFIDSDLLVHRNIDFLFQLPEISATGNDENRFNSGVMVIEPSNCTFKILMDQILVTRSYNGGDQGYLNEIFPWWHRIPKRLNFLKHFWSNSTEELKTKTELFAADPPVLYVMHYLGLKPWLCFRDYDCNWNIQGLRVYASDVAHASWYKIHDSMPISLQRHCWLRTLAKAAREAERREAEEANYQDMHWKIEIHDPRLEYCPTPEHCDWQEMLRHWNEPPTNDTTVT